MSTGRMILIAAGLLIALGALFLILQGFRGAAASPAAAVPAEPAAGTRSGGKAGDKAPPPRWESFFRPQDRTAPQRPVLRLAQDLPNPFDRLPGGGARRQDPGLRLEGISIGAQAMALLSGRAVRVGDTVSGYRVARIVRSAVTLAGPEGTRIELSLRQERPAGGGR